MTKSMTTGNPVKLILLFSLPLIVGNIFQQFYSMADTLIVGRTIGVNALAAVGCTGSLTFFILGFIMGFASGLSIITAQRFGAEDEEGIKKSFATSIVLSGILAVVMAVVSSLFAMPALKLLQTPSEIIHDAYSYMIVILLGIPTMVLYNLTSNMIRALGDSKTPLYFLIIACSSNIVMDFGFILFLHMGVAGAGWATVLAQLLSGVCCCIYIKKKMPILWVEKRHFVLAKEEIMLHLKTAFPMAFQMSIISIGSLMVQFALNGLGAVSVAAYTAAQKIDSIATMPINSLGATMATYSAQNYGAGRLDRVKKGVMQCCVISVSFSFLMTCMNIFAGGRLAAIFVGSGEAEVLRLAKIYLSIDGVFYWILALLFIFRFTIQGLGNGSIPMMAGAVELVARASGSVVLVKMFGFAGACFSNTLAWVMAGTLLTVEYFRFIKKLTANTDGGSQSGSGRKFQIAVRHNIRRRKMTY